MTRASIRSAVAGLTGLAVLLAGAQCVGNAGAATRVLEAEQATVVNGAVESNHAGYTGTGFVNYANRTGGYVEWPVTDAVAGPAVLTFRYANGSGGDRPSSVTVGGMSVGALTFPATGAWTTWGTQTLTVQLAAGDNRVRLTATTGGGGPNVDSLTVNAQNPAPSPSASAQTDWSVALVESGMTRLNRSIMGGWYYPNGLYLHGQYLVYKRTGDRRYLDYITRYVDKFVNRDGVIDAQLDTLDNMLPGHLLLDLYVETGDERYRTAAAQIRKRLDSYPRTADGGFIHKIALGDQLWSDGVYMGMPLLTRYGAIIGDGEYAFDEATKQLVIYYSHLRRSDGLLWHAYDEPRTATWADPQTGLSAEPWCRAIGWFAMATVDILEVLPENHPRRAELVRMVRDFARGFARYQDPATGRWFQVVDQGGRSDNWTETSCSSMYTYMLSRGVEQGHLDAGYREVARKGYQGVLQKIFRSEDGAVSLVDISTGTDVGTYDYYVARQRNTNDLHGLGAFLIMNEQMIRAG